MLFPSLFIFHRKRKDWKSDEKEGTIRVNRFICIPDDLTTVTAAFTDSLSVRQVIADNPANGYDPNNDPDCCLSFPGTSGLVDVVRNANEIE